MSIDPLAVATDGYFTTVNLTYRREGIATDGWWLAEMTSIWQERGETTASWTERSETTATWTERAETTGTWSVR